MDVLILLIGAWWLAGVLGFRKKSKKKWKSASYKPDNSVYDWEEFQKRNAR
jgi:hypothetical protein